jgi:CBS domain-containing protein
MTMRARELMTYPVVTVRLDDSAKQAARLLVTHGFTALPVVDDEDRLLGIVTEADLIDNRILPDPRTLIDDQSRPVDPPAPRQVDAVMTHDPVAVTSATDAADVSSLMLERGLRAVPVVDDGQLVGILTRRDLLRAIARDDESIAREIRSRLYMACRQPWHVAVRDGVVTLVSDDPDPVERHIATVIAQASPGVRRVDFATASPRPS